MTEVRDEETYAIIGAAMEVHKVLGHGFLEVIYQEALHIELIERGIPTQRECSLSVSYKGRLLGCGFRVDFICFNGILVELKATSALSGHEEAQIINYLKASGSEKALMLNFGAPSLQYRRMALTR
jgi:GxxExxY protein